MITCSKCGNATNNIADTCAVCGAPIIHAVDTNQRKEIPSPFVTNIPAQVKIVDIEMTFMSMVTFMVKLVFAAIPAGIIVFVIFAFLTGIMAGIFRH